MSRTCKSRGCNWPIRGNDDICDECAINGTPAQQAAALKLNERQRSLLLSFKGSHDEGKKSPPYFEPFGIGRLQLGGEGQTFRGMIDRGLVSERNNIFYITDKGLAALATTPGDPQ